ncbi:MFS transporter [Janibacter sp. UYMM211]|uniref:MFS transporter n=1 Tax=Janibacter sp. UYMM211 TaxID=3156342 RepID=UPI00339A3B8C
MSTSTAASDQTELARPPQSTVKVIRAAVLGTVVEYYDFGIYGYMAAILATHFFVATDDTTALLNTFAAFAVAFFLRIPGGIFFGHIGDKYGRKKSLTYTILLMAVATAGIGMLPTYATLGVWATAVLVLCRCLQGFAAGGELSGANAFVSARPAALLLGHGRHVGDVEGPRAISDDAPHRDGSAFVLDSRPAPAAEQRTLTFGSRLRGQPGRGAQGQVVLEGGGRAHQHVDGCTHRTNDRTPSGCCSRARITRGTVGAALTSEHHGSTAHPRRICRRCARPRGCRRTGRHRRM